jgi:putative flippase GtrA
MSRSTAESPLLSLSSSPLSAVGRGWGGVPVIVRYGIAGMVTQIVYLSVLGAALALNWHYLLAMSLGQVCAIAFAFPTYRAQVFRSDGPWLPQLAKFLGVWWTGVAISFVGVPLLVEGFHVHPFPAQLVMLVGVVVMSFLSHRGITFRAGRDVAVEAAAPALTPATFGAES